MFFFDCLICELNNKSKNFISCFYFVIDLGFFCLCLVCNFIFNFYEVLIYSLGENFIFYLFGIDFVFFLFFFRVSFYLLLIYIFLYFICVYNLRRRLKNINLINFFFIIVFVILINLFKIL